MNIKQELFFAAIGLYVCAMNIWAFVNDCTFDYFGKSYEFPALVLLCSGIFMGTISLILLIDVIRRFIKEIFKK